MAIQLNAIFKYYIAKFKMHRYDIKSQCIVIGAGEMVKRLSIITFLYTIWFDS